MHQRYLQVRYLENLRGIKSLRLILQKKTRVSKDSRWSDPEWYFGRGVQVLDLKIKNEVNQGK